MPTAGWGTEITLDGTVFGMVTALFGAVESQAHWLEDNYYSYDKPLQA